MKQKIKKGLEVNFAIIFAVLVGGIIIILGIYAATQFVETESEIYNSEVALELGKILVPVETGLEEGKSYSFSTIDESRIENKCRNTGVFGEQEIGVSVRKNIGQEWKNSGANVKTRNKYVFSERRTEGKDFELFIKPLEMPYKIGDVIVLYSNSKTYCFVNPPDWIREDLEVGLKGVNITENKRDCTKESVIVCFNNEACNVSISFINEFDESAGIVRKSNKNMEFYGPLLYGAVFSEKEIYDCQVNRMRKRGSELARLYSGKAVLVNGRGCSTGMDQDLEAYSLELKNEGVSLISIIGESESLRRANDKLSCELF